MKAALAGLVLGALVATALNHLVPTLEVPARARVFSLETGLVGGGSVVRAGDHVDVLSVLQLPDSKRLVGVTLLQNVVVLANAAPSSGEARQLSLLLIPAEAQLLALAREGGKLSVTLRNPSDDGLLESTDLATLSSTLLGSLVPPPNARGK
jgi:Flp pilus assembly protein CpaB